MTPRRDRRFELVAPGSTRSGHVARHGTAEAGAGSARSRPISHTIGHRCQDRSSGADGTPIEASDGEYVAPAVEVGRRPVGQQPPRSHIDATHHWVFPQVVYGQSPAREQAQVLVISVTRLRLKPVTSLRINSSSNDDTSFAAVGKETSSGLRTAVMFTSGCWNRWFRRLRAWRHPPPGVGGAPAAQQYRRSRLSRLTRGDAYAIEEEADTGPPSLPALGWPSICRSTRFGGGAGSSSGREAVA